MPTRDPSPSFRYKITIKGVNTALARFTEISGIGFDSTPDKYEEGGEHTRVHYFPGRAKFTELTLKKGIAEQGSELWDWVKKTINGTIEPHDITVTLLQLATETPLRAWTFSQAFPIKWSASAFNSEQSAIAIETLVLTHQGMTFD